MRFSEFYLYKDPQNKWAWHVRVELELETFHFLIYPFLIYPPQISFDVEEFEQLLKIRTSLHIRGNTNSLILSFTELNSTIKCNVK